MTKMGYGKSLNLLSGTDFRFTVNLPQLLTVLNAISKRFSLPQHMDLSSYRHQNQRLALIRLVTYGAL